MDTLDRLNLLSSDFMALEPAEEAACPKISALPPLTPATPAPRREPAYVSHAQLPNGKQITLLKSLQTSACERNCFYCPFRSGRDFRRATLKPDEMAGAFMDLHRAGIAEGIFLSSGVAGGGIRTQDQMIATAEILRTQYQYTGYMHLKLMPGIERAQVERSMQLADRVSVNLEAPNQKRLEKLAPTKQFMDELLQPLRWVEEIRRSMPSHLGWKGRWPSMTTQFVVGAVGESDLELLSTTEALTRRLRLSRAYFSAFHPITDTPLENLPAEDPLRQNRLYQASFLLRDYGFSLEDLPFENAGDLPRHTDPKLAWARLHLSERPLEINTAYREELLRVPGIGPKSVDAVLAARRQGRLQAAEDLRRLGINPQRAAPFILLDGRSVPRQLSLW